MSLSAVVVAAFAAVTVSEDVASAPRIVSVQWEKELVRVGDGEWDLHLEPLGERPILYGVDNKGNIIVGDTYDGRVLTFTPEGERLAIIDVSGHVSVLHGIGVNEENQLYVWGLAPDYQQYKEIMIRRTPAGQEIQVLDPDSVELGPGAVLWREYSRELEPLGYDGLFGVRVEVDGELKYQAVDRDGKFIQFIPSLYRDQKSRFYDLHLDALRVYDAQGELQVQIQVPMARYLMQYQGWVYVYCGNHHLYRFGETGEQEDDITTKQNSPALWGAILTSPRADYLYTLQRKSLPQGLSIHATRWTISETASDDDEAGSN